MPRRRFVAGLMLLVVVVAVVFVFRAALVRAVVAAAIDVSAGANVSFGALAIDGDTIDARDVHFARGGSLVVDVRRVVVRYRLHDAVFGGPRRYGLVSVDLERPAIELTRLANGAFDVGGSNAPAPAQARTHGAGAQTPLVATIAMRDGTLALRDPGRTLAGSRELDLAQIAITANVDTAASTTYRAGLRVPGDPVARMSAAGRVDASGYAVQRVRANDVAILPFVNYFINTSTAQIFAGRLYAGDVTFYSFGSATHVSGSARVEGAAMSIPGIMPPANDMSGRIDFYDNGIATSHLLARIGALHAIASGGLYGFDLGSPVFRLGIAVAHAPLERARELFGFSRTLPIAGAARIETFLEGPAPKPVVITRVRAPAASYAGFPATALDGRALLYDDVVSIADTHARYDGLDVGAGGTIETGDVAHIDLVATVDGPAARVPYAAQLAPNAQVHVVGRLAGDGLKLDARGELFGESPAAARDGTTLRGFFHVDPLGEGTFGPLLATRSDGASLAGTFYLDRERSDSAFWLDAHGYTFASLAPAPRFPGLDLYPPDFDATLDGSVAGFGPPSDFRIAGHVRANGLRVAKLALGTVAGDVTGHIGDMRIGRATASGAWGTLAGSGAFLGARLIMAGDYRGSFEKLRTFTGDLGAHGPLNGPIALTIDPSATVVQSSGADAHGANVRGVPIDRVSGTLAIAKDRLRLYAANARVASGAFVAAGSLATTASRDAAERVVGIGVSVTGADAARLHAIVPVDGGGTVATIGRFRNDGATTRYDGGVAIARADVQRVPIAGNGEIELAGTRLGFSHTTALAGDAVAALDGDVTALGTKRPRYDATIALSETALAPLVHAIEPGRRDLAGTVAGTFVVRGSNADLAVRGNLSMPEGSYNGLAFRDASAHVEIAPGGIGAQDGTITVGSTVTRFDGFFHGGEGGFHVEAPQADLSDFNDLFDTGDTLGGRGHVDGRFVMAGGVVGSSADIGIAALKYRTFALGDAIAHWNSRGSSVTGNVAFGGRSGRLETAGTLDLATRAPLDKLLERSRFSGDAHLRGLDLGVWLPALGYQLPVTGRIDADATIAGLLRNPDVRTSATLANGTIGKLPVDRFAIVASSTLSRTTLQSLDLEVPSLSITGSGNFGLGAKDPVALRLHAKSPSVGAFAGTLLGAKFPVSGTGEADVTVDGTRASPRVGGGFDLETAALRGIAIPRALGEFTIRGRDLVLSDVEVAFTTGTLYVAGSLPLQLSPFALGPAHAPVELDLTARSIDLANFAPLFPSGSTLKGTLAGRVDVSGTASAPEINGSLALANGAASTPLETVPITDLRGTLAFEGTSVSLRDLHATAGGGTLDASGSATLADLMDLGADAKYRFDAKARGLHLSLPAYGSGQLDGTLALEHVRGSTRTLSGKLALSDATIPFAALLVAGASGSDELSATPVVAPVAAKEGSLALDLTVAADRNVRVRSANVDLGGRGSLHVGGTLGAPALEGGFDSTGGTLTYFNTVFRVSDGRVSFAPDRGVIPDLTAHAETHVIDPDPNTVRNIAGTADVTLDIKGPVTGLTIGLTSDPSYDREQILGLLLNAPALGATNLFDTPGQATLYGSNSPSTLPHDVAASRYNNGSTTVAQEAFGVANAQFTRTLLAPAETTFANAVGLTNFNVNVDLTGNVGLQARKVLGKEVSAVYGTTIGYPYRQSFGFELKPNIVTAAQVTIFQTFGNTGLTSLTPGTLTPGFGSTRLTAAEPSSGTVGFSLSLQRLFP